MEETQIGVGPHAKPWPTDSKYDTELLEQGDRRNVEDQYRYWTVDAIVADLDKMRSGLHIAIENFQHDSNIGTIVRSANAFNVSAVHIIGKRHWNRRGAMVTDRYLHIFHHATVEDFIAVMSDRSVIAVDNVEGAVCLAVADLPRNAVLVFGGEGPGLSTNMREQAKQMVMIEQFGSTRSLNVGVAAGIVIYHWTRKYVIDNT